MVDRVCVVCGDKLTGSQKILCGKKTCRYVHNQPYYLKYQKQRYSNIRIERYCIVCGKKLKGRQRKYCSTHRYTKNHHNIYEIQNQSTKPLPEPPKNNNCEECGGQIIFKDNEYFCSICGLVVE
jgi:hypothetical protein